VIIWGAPTLGINIKNKQFAEANRNYFKILWDGAKEKK
jgi:ABC-type taurine transport system substrate-binding protein